MKMKSPKAENLKEAVLKAKKAAKRTPIAKELQTGNAKTRRVKIRCPLLSTFFIAILFVLKFIQKTGL